MTALELTSKGFVLLIWGAIGCYFLTRFLEYKKLVSLALVGMAMGWLILGMGYHWRGWQFLAIALGLFIAFSIWRVERRGN